jgi:cell fate (sporulation/competence/biofilm development) regulator YlbF (YheA/YmcA/DUF963 family)
MNHTTKNQRRDVRAATQALAASMSSAEQFVSYWQAERTLNQDRPARQLLHDLAAAQAELRRRQYDNSLSQEDLQRLRSLQEAVQSTGSISEHTAAQQRVIALVREVNQEISQLLGIDFGSLAKRSGCC